MYVPYKCSVNNTISTFMSMLASSREECAQQKVGAKDNVSVWVMLDSCVLLSALILAAVHVVASVLVIRQGSPAMKS